MRLSEHLCDTMPLPTDQHHNGEVVPIRHALVQAYSRGLLGLLLILSAGGLIAIAPPGSLGIIPASASDTNTMEFTIPAGTAQTGMTPLVDSAISVPRQISFNHVSSATILIHNSDTVTQRAGPWVVPAGQTSVQHFSRPGFYDFVCTQDWREEVMVRVGDVVRTNGH